MFKYRVDKNGNKIEPELKTMWGCAKPSYGDYKYDKHLYLNKTRAEARQKELGDDWKVIELEAYI